MKVDVIIVGQGLAGTALAFEFTRNNISFHIFDKGTEGSSSSVAAGIFNPVVYKRLNAVWRANEAMQKVKDLYGYAEELLGESFLHYRNTIKIFSAANDAVNWTRCEHPVVNQYIDREVHHEQKTFNTPFGFANVKGTGNLDVKTFIRSARKYFKSKGLLTETVINEADVILSSDHVELNGVTGSKIVFCEGTKVSPFWDMLPFRPVKGEVLHVEIPALNCREILVKDGFLLPTGGSNYILGSTYEWDDLSPVPTQKGRADLQAKLSAITSCPYTIVDHLAAVRPASHDRRAFVGWHKEHPHIGILNGLGARGVLLAPICASNLTQNILTGESIYPEINVLRVLN